ncbi:MAG TPA: AAA family ATPase [Candidatus Saccharimonadales bacterium]|nr:AAA family ATPase [Candidatus Saccharimonadales bacterium]
MKIIGLAGTNGSGKDTVAQILSEDYGFFVVSATEMLEEELKIRGFAFERENKRKVGNEWREQYGLSAIVDKAIEQAKSKGAEKLVVGSLRHPAEAEKVKELNGIVVWVDADPHKRYERIQQNNRGRVEDQKTFEQFLQEEQDEMQNKGEATGISGAEVKKLADIFIKNDSNQQLLKQNVDDGIHEYL